MYVGIGRPQLYYTLLKIVKDVGCKKCSEMEIVANNKERWGAVSNQS